MNEEEAIERLNRYKTIKVLYGNTFAIHLEQLEQLQNDIETVLNLLEKKNKQIDEMAKTINEAYFEGGDFEEWFENKICKVQKYEDYTYLEKDIKQYFEYKVEEDKYYE